MKEKKCLDFLEYDATTARADPMLAFSIFGIRLDDAANGSDACTFSFWGYDAATARADPTLAKFSIKNVGRCRDHVVLSFVEYDATTARADSTFATLRIQTLVAIVAKIRIYNFGEYDETTA